MQNQNIGMASILFLSNLQQNVLSVYNDYGKKPDFCALFIFTNIQISKSKTSIRHRRRESRKSITAQFVFSSLSRCHIVIYVLIFYRFSTKEKNMRIILVFILFLVYETPFLYILVHLASENKMYMYTWRIQTECKCTPGPRFPLETLPVTMRSHEQPDIFQYNWQWKFTS